jgi:hypothetical protein
MAGNYCHKCEVCKLLPDQVARIEDAPNIPGWNTIDRGLESAKYTPDEQLAEDFEAELGLTEEEAAAALSCIIGRQTGWCELPEYTEALPVSETDC